MFSPHLVKEILNTVIAYNRIIYQRRNKGEIFLSLSQRLKRSETNSVKVSFFPTRGRV